MSKRSSSPGPGGSLIKRVRSGDSPSAGAGAQTQIAISNNNDQTQKALVRTIQRTSNLDAPIVSLAGAHSAEILSCRFDPTGQNIAACSADRSVSLWRTYPPNTNYGHIQHIHKAPILDLQWSLTSPLIYTASADSTIGLSDVTTGQRVRRLRGHTGVINALDRVVAAGAGVELLASAGDDGFVRVWEGGEEGSKMPVGELKVGCPVTAVAFSLDGTQLFAGALDNEVHVYDLRTQQEVYSLGGHTDTPISLSVSPSGNYLLAPSFSSTTIVHDIRPFAPAAGGRVHRALTGAPAGFENTLLRGAWSKDDGGARVAVGGADRAVCVWDVDSGKILYKLPGHKGTVTAVDFHPREPIILTGGKDATMLLGELEPAPRV